MITQSLLSLNGRKAFVFCRQNAIYMSYAKNNSPSAPIILQNNVHKGFNICPVKDGFLIFFRAIYGQNSVLKISASGVTRPNIDDNILNVSTGAVFIFNTEKILYSAPDGFIHSLNGGTPLFEFGDASKCRTLFLANDGILLFVKDKKLRLYSSVKNTAYDLYNTADNVEDISICSIKDTLYISMLVKTAQGFELLYKTISGSNASKPVPIIKTQTAQGAFIFPYGNSIRTVISNNLKVFSRITERDKLSFSPIESMELKEPSKIFYFEQYTSDFACCDALCDAQGVVIFPQETYAENNVVDKKGTKNDFYKKALLEKDRVISTLNTKLNQLQKNSYEAIHSLNESLLAAQDKNTALMNEIESLRNTELRVTETIIEQNENNITVPISTTPIEQISASNPIALPVINNNFSISAAETAEDEE